jgi:5-formyltetrahydrofolate cyclo-ligase
MSNDQELRQAMRHQRRALTRPQRDIAAQQLLNQFNQLPMIDQCENIAVYHAFDGEINLAPFIDNLWHIKKSVYLPILADDSKIMRFGLYEKHTPLKLNRYQILEPMTLNTLTATEMDLILLPLVAFDDAGHRLGMGSGYYDATLQKVNHKPYLIGAGYEFQKVNHIVTKATDVILHGIITETHYYAVLAT